jgi:hypothetical protein
MTIRQETRGPNSPGPDSRGPEAAAHGTSDRIQASVGEAALLRLRVTGEDWAEDLPPAPPGHRVSVSFTTGGTGKPTRGHHAALAALGYRVVDNHQGCGWWADFLVPFAVAESHPAWWRALTEQAFQAFRLSMGPVAHSLDDALRPHARE